jgi:hypothetical protein
MRDSFLSTLSAGWQRLGSRRRFTGIELLLPSEMFVNLDAIGGDPIR